MQVSIPRKLIAKAGRSKQTKSAKVSLTKKGFTGQASMNTTMAPTSIGTSQQTRSPRVTQSRQSQKGSQAGTRVVHSEFVMSISGSVAFQQAIPAGLVCNPGNATTFPYLSVQAASWERYRFNRLRFRYVTRTATTTVGSVLMGADYDPTDPAPQSETVLAAMAGTVEGPVWKDMVLDLPVSRMHGMLPKKLIRTTRPGGVDLSLYDAARFFLATIEETGTAAIGKLWVDYDVEFFIPQIANTSISTTSAGSSSLYYVSSNQVITTGVATVVAFDTVECDALGFGTPSLLGVFTPAAGIYCLETISTVQDATNETFTAVVTVYKDSVAQDAAKCLSATIATFTIPTRTIIACNGTNQVSVSLTLTGAAGTLTYLGGIYGSIKVTMA